MIPEFAEIYRKINESPMMINKDANFEEVGYEFISSRSSYEWEQDFDLLSKEFIKVNNQNLSLYVAKYRPVFVVGKFYIDSQTKKKRFAEIFSLFCIDFKLKSNFRKIKNRKAVKIDSVHTAKDFRKQGIATRVYEEISKHYIIVSDSLQFKGAVRLWKNIIASKTNDTYLYDSNEDKFITKVTDKSHLNSIWSEDLKKKRMLLVMVNKNG